MSHSTLIVSTCGTSLLRNGADATDRTWLDDHANLAETAASAEIRRRVEDIADAARSRLAMGDVAAARESAEINGILALKRELGTDRVEHRLIVTDTLLGRCTGELLREFLQARGEPCILEVIPGLRTDDRAGFQDAMATLTAWCVATLPGYRHRGTTVIFHLTGGFKATLGFLVTIGMLHADRIAYLFEHGSELLVIPRLPLALTDRGLVVDHLRLFRRMAADLPVDAAEIPEPLRLYSVAIGGAATLGPWGELTFGSHRASVYRERVWPPCSDRLRYGPAFESSLKGLDADRIHHVNERVDDLAVLFELERRRDRCKFKPIVGQVAPGSTHEAYAWSDRDARRLLLHREGDIWVLDRLAAHL